MPQTSQTHYYYWLFGFEWQEPWTLSPSGWERHRSHLVSYRKLPELQQLISARKVSPATGFVTFWLQKYHTFQPLCVLLTPSENTLTEIGLRDPSHLMWTVTCIWSPFLLKVHQRSLHLLAEYQLSMFHSCCGGESIIVSVTKSETFGKPCQALSLNPHKNSSR